MNEFHSVFRQHVNIPYHHIVDYLSFTHIYIYIIYSFYNVKLDPVNRLFSCFQFIKIHVTAIL